ncbi:hypothetical protein BHE74_00048509, partial [Ensete ventricosum]
MGLVRAGIPTHVNTCYCSLARFAISHRTAQYERYQPGYNKKDGEEEAEEERERGRRGGRHLRLENLGMMPQIRRISRGGDFFATVFSSSEATRKRGGGLGDVIEASPHPHQEEKTR